METNKKDTDPSDDYHLMKPNYFGFPTPKWLDSASLVGFLLSPGYVILGGPVAAICMYAYDMSVTKASLTGITAVTAFYGMVWSMVREILKTD